MTPPYAPIAEEAGSLPAAADRRLRGLARAGREQRLIALLIAALAAAAALVWTAAARLRDKPPLVVRAPASLRERAAEFGGAPEVSYDQIAFFLSGCLPLLYASRAGEHPLLPLLQGLVAPPVYAEAERRLRASASAARERDATQSLNLTGVDRLVADGSSGRAAGEARGFVTVTTRGSAARLFPWSAHVLVEASPPGRLDPYPFVLLKVEPSPAEQPDAKSP